jgi:hypothetical protein
LIVTGVWSLIKLNDHVNGSRAYVLQIRSDFGLLPKQDSSGQQQRERERGFLHAIPLYPDLLARSEVRQ